MHMNEWKKVIYENVAKEKGVSTFLLQDNRFYSSNVLGVLDDGKLRVVLEIFLEF